MFRQRLGSRAISFFGARFCVVPDAAHRDSSTLALLYAAARRLRVIRFVNDSRPSLASLPFFLFVFARSTRSSTPRCRRLNRFNVLFHVATFSRDAENLKTASSHILISVQINSFLGTCIEKRYNSIG